MGISALLASQILDASATGRSVLTGADASAIRTTLGLGTLSTQSPTGTPSASTFLRGDFSWQTIDLSGYVPYSGATGAVNLGANGLTARLGTFTGATNSGTQILRVDGTGGGFTRINDNGTVSISSDVSSGTNPLTISYNNSVLWQFAFNGTFSGNTGTVLNIGAGLMHLTSSGSGASAKANINTFYDLVIAPGGIGGGSASSVVEVRNSTNSQRLNLYGTYTDASNYRRLFLSSTTAGAFTLGVEGAGTGASGNTLTLGNPVSVTGGTITASTPALNVSQTWNNAATTFTGILANVTDTASNAASLLLDLQVGGSSKFKVDKKGTITSATGTVPSSGGVGSEGLSLQLVYSNYGFGVDGTGRPIVVINSSQEQRLGLNTAIGSTGSYGWSSSAQANQNASFDLTLFRDTSDTLAQRRSTNPQVHRIYNTYTDASNYERAKIAWESNVLVIGSEKGGTGAVRTTTYTSSSHTIIDCANGANVYIKSRGINVLTIDGASYFIDPGTGISLGSDDDRYGNTSTLLCLSTAKIRSASARLDGTEAAPTNLTIRAGNATGRNSPTTFIVGANVVIYGGDGAINSSGAANGGHVYLDGGRGYGTGVDGSIIIGATRARLLAFGGTTSSFPAIKRNSAALNFRLADDSADCDITAKAATFSGNVTVSAVNLVTDTTTGTKIGTGTTQKLGFYNSTPVVQPTAVADATDAASVITQLNALLSRMRDLGLIAT